MSAWSVILLNPAFEASRYTALDGITRIEEDFAENQLPLLLSISSEGDWATKTAFPIGQWLGFYRTDKELVTLGNYKKFETHSLRTLKSDQCGSPGGKDLSEAFLANGLCLSRDVVANNDDQIIQPRNPFLVARTTSEIIRDHNDIWNDRFSGWLFAYINALGQQKRPRLPN
jgi:hypothetical protein